MPSSDRSLVALVAVLGLYRGRVLQMLDGLVGRDRAGRRMAVNLIVAFLPAALIGPLAAGAIKDRLFSPVLSEFELGEYARSKQLVDVRYLVCKQPLFTHVAEQCFDHVAVRLDSVGPPIFSEQLAQRHQFSLQPR